MNGVPTAWEGGDEPAVGDGDPVGVADVRSAIATLTTNAPQGSVERTARSFTIYDNSQLLAASPWNDAIIAYRNGAPVRVRDVGQAVDAADTRHTVGDQPGRWSTSK
jgi:multidrug efflux pump subunit AcrB